MEKGTQLTVAVSMLSKETLVEMLEKEIENWKKSSPEQREEAWAELSFNASLILVKDMAPDIGTAVKMGKLLDEKFNDEDLEREFNLAKSPFPKNKDIN